MFYEHTIRESFDVRIMFFFQIFYMFCNGSLHVIQLIDLIKLYFYFYFPCIQHKSNSRLWYCVSPPNFESSLYVRLIFRVLLFLSYFLIHLIFKFLKTNLLFCKMNSKNLGEKLQLT